MKKNLIKYRKQHKNTPNYYTPCFSTSLKYSVGSLGNLVTNRLGWPSTIRGVTKKEPKKATIPSGMTGKRRE